MLAKKPGVDGSEYINASYLHVSFNFYKIKSVMLRISAKFGASLIKFTHKNIKKILTVQKFFLG